MQNLHFGLFSQPAQPGFDPRIGLSPPTVHADGIPGFEVFVLGTKGSGKTVFLAALYKSLLSQDTRRNAFRLECVDKEQNSELLEKLEQLEAGKWPPGDYEVSKFEFICHHRLSPMGSANSPGASSGQDARGREIPLFRFDYFDYPGGFITRPPPGFVQERVKSAHSILVLLDGRKIHDLVERSNPGIYAELDKLMAVLVECVGRPVHFLITKSDIIDFRAHSLEKIRDALLAHRNFRNIVEQLCEYGRVHLVPVSAVGTNFAVYENGEMKRLPNGMMEPLSVDLSIGFTLTDYIRQIKKLKDDPENTYPAAKLMLIKASRWVAARLLQIKGVTEKISNSESLRVFAIWIPINIPALLKEIESVAQLADSRLENAATGIELAIKRMTDEIQDKRSAQAAIIRIQAALVAAFEAKFPASNLNAVAETQP